CDEVNACRRLMDKVDLKGYQIGRTKVFLRAGQMAELDSHRSRVLGKSACKIQRRIRFYLDRKKFISLRMSAIQIQALCRGQDARHIYGHRRRTAAALIIQKDARTFFARKAYALLSSSAILIQAGMRGVAARNELWLRKKTKSAILIQSRCRGTLACCGYLRLKRAAIAAQCAWRAKLACKELRMLKSVISSMKTLMKEDSGHADSNSFLLDDNSSIPFSVDDISRSLQHADFTRALNFYRDKAVFLQLCPMIFQMPTYALALSAAATDENGLWQAAVVASQIAEYSLISCSSFLKYNVVPIYGVVHHMPLSSSDCQLSLQILRMPYSGNFILFSRHETITYVDLISELQQLGPKFVKMWFVVRLISFSPLDVIQFVAFVNSRRAMSLDFSAAINSPHQEG
ncbi:UNVERIFIED_CONTAM: Myosin-8, partial [Sesamum indicum]